METLLKSKGLWQYTKTLIPDLIDDQAKFGVNEKMNEVVGILTTYISREIRFHTSDINCPCVVRNKLKSLFDKVNESQVM